MESVALRTLATTENFDEAAYLAENADIAEAIARGVIASGRAHFDRYGKAEGRYQRMAGDFTLLRRVKMEKLRPLLRTDMPYVERDGKLDFLSAELRRETGIVDTHNVSSNGYDERIGAMIDRYRDGLILDCGAGRRDSYIPNIVNYEIVDYDTTDVLGVGERLPFRDGAFDAVISVAVLEHVRDPFACADEIKRVLKPGGDLFCSIPFLQPYHGYPHHYFNATPQGIRRLFEDRIDIQEVSVADSTHPYWALHWIVKSWAEGLDPGARRKFKDLKVKDLLEDPRRAVKRDFCAQLPEAKKLELACATVLIGRKQG